MDDRATKKKKPAPINDKEFVHDGMPSHEIKKTVQTIRAYLEKPGAAKLEERVSQIKIDHSFFAERYPMLFEMCIRKDFNYEHLNYFLNKRDEIINDHVSSEDASKTVGKEWFDKFVDVSKLEAKK